MNINEGKMQLISGTFVYEPHNFKYYFQDFLNNCLGSENVNYQKEGLYTIIFQDKLYEIRLEEHTVVNCFSIAFYGTDLKEFTLFPPNKFLLVIQHFLISFYRLDYIECPFYEPQIFLKIKDRIIERITTQSKIKKLYKNTFAVNTNIKDDEYHVDLSTIDFSLKYEETIQPYTLNIFETKNQNILIEAFLLRVGLELNWDNSFLFESLFVPLTIDETFSLLKLAKSQEYFNSIKSEIESIIQIYEYDSLTIIIKSKEKISIIGEFFWWS
jgi:hypothetical protein